MSRLQKIIFISLLVAQGVVIGLIENMIPYPFAFAPGAKLGLANLITIIALFTMPKRDSFLLIWLRLILTTLLGGTVSTFLYSMSGSLLSYFGMLLVKQLGPKRVSIIGISAAGGFFTQCWPIGHSFLDCSILECHALPTRSRIFRYSIRDRHRHRRQLSFAKSRHITAISA